METETKEHSTKLCAQVINTSWIYYHSIVKQIKDLMSCLVRQDNPKYVVLEWYNLVKIQSKSLPVPVRFSASWIVCASITILSEGPCKK